MISSGAETDPKWTANITNYFTKAQWNVTNASYALNQTLTDMWTPFLSTTNSSYLMIDKFNVTNKTYRTNYNLTWVGNLNSTATVYSEGINNLTIPFLFNSTGLIRNWNVSGDIQNWNASTYIRNWGLDTSLLNTTNLTYLMIDRFNVTNTTYYPVWNPFGYYNSTNPQTETDPKWTANITNYFTKAQWNATNDSYLKDYGDTATGNYTFDAGTLFIGSDTDRVGIGKLAPTTTLDVNGTINASQMLVNNTPVLTIANWNSTNTSYYPVWNPYGYYNSTNPSPVTNESYLKDYGDTATGNYTFDAGTLFIGSDTDRVGIGKLAPTTTLDVNGTINASQMLVNGTAVLTINQWNATNSSYALNQTLTDMWTPFLSTTNASYLMIDRFNVTNKTYRTMDNVTFPGLFVNASHIATSGVNTTHILDNTILAIDLNSDVNTSMDLRYFTKAQWNVTNESYLKDYGDTATGNYTFDAGTLFIGSDTDKVGIGKLAPTTTLDVNGTINASQMLVNGTAVLTIANWNSTNSSYALNQTLTDMWTPFLSTTNSSYLMVDKFNVTNSSYRENYNLTWVGNLNVTQNFSVNNNNLFVDSVTGNVGIGTTGPFTKLTINGTTFAEMDLTNGATALLGNDILGKYSFRSIDADAHVGGDQTLGGMYGVIVHEAGGTAVIDGSADEGFELSFTTAKRPSPNALFTLTEAMRINKLGNVGIGTANPLTALQIGVPDASQILV